MNIKTKIINTKLFKQPTFNSLNGELIIDKNFINKKSPQKFLKKKRIFGENLLNMTLTAFFKDKTKQNKNRNTFSKLKTEKESTKIKTLQSKNDKYNTNYINQKWKDYNFNANNKLKIKNIQKQNENIKNNEVVKTKLDNKKENNKNIISLNTNKNTFYKEPIIKSLYFKENKRKKIINVNEANIFTSEDLKYVKEYQKEIFSYLTSLERKIIINPNYISFQKDISEKMREILIDWVINAHLNFKLSNETLFLTIILIDRYLQKVQVTRKNLQLVGIASLLIACKYEEIYPPLIKSFLNITNNVYNKNELLNMESNILENLEYDICYPSPLRYMEMLCIKLGYINDNILTNKMNFLLELILTKIIFYKYSHIELVIACFLLSCKSKDDNFEENKEQLLQKCFSCFFVFFDKYKVDRIYECFEELENLVKDLYHNKNSFKTIKNKYAMQNYESISDQGFWKNII